MNVNAPVLYGEELLQLIKEKGNRCISIILPTHRVSADRKIDKFQMEKAMELVRQALKVKYKAEEYGPLLKKLEVLAHTIDYNHNLEGLGLYVSENVELLVKFPFQVQEKIVVGDNFEIRDLVLYTQLTRPYLALMVSEKQIRLLSSNGAAPKEITGEDFPMGYDETYLYNTPSRGSSQPFNAQMRSFEHDKSKIEEIRCKNFFRAADENLSKFMIHDTPLVVMGAEKVLSWYEDVTSFHNHIVDRIHGNYEHTSIAEISAMMASAMEAKVKRNVESLIAEFRERVGEGRGVSGIQEVWTVASEGRGWKLVVEKQYKIPGFLKEGNDIFLLLAPDKSPHTTLADAVDDVMERVLENGGNVYFADKDQLAEFGRIVLITRY